MENSFETIDDDTTKWTMYSDFKCGGVLRIMALLAPSIFKKDSLKYMQQFKAFAESA